MARAEEEQTVEAAEGYRETVGDYLARAREEHGQDLRSVSDSLRIRFVYLEAIEEGRYRDLPGSTYAVGFVRTYADYLGLDSDEVVRRFKEEMGGLDRRQRLVFPVPKPEGRVPGGAIILISFLLVAIAYGGWYVFQSDENIMDMLSEGGGLLSEESATVPEGETAAALEQGAEPAPVPAEDEPALGETVETEPSVTSEPLPPLEETAEPAQSSLQELAETPAEETLPPAEGNGALEITEDPAEDVAAGPLPEEVAAQDPPLDAGAEQLSATPPAAPELATSETAASGDLFGAPEDQPVRIVIEAANDAWIQVFDENNELLIARVLRTGDRYRVPQEPGLSMLTGNAGGLEVRVDGAVVPSLGPFGQVVRNIALDPVLLLNGTAVGAAANPE